ncbi:MAG: hydrogenase maturation nickel metallochaperone HypA [Candidatus Bipolaricaulota bacterium]|nr:hydrogenase maturation nickel metallochaperone HypA [Candidatus Bipolaricaulota bacterium]
MHEYSLAQALLAGLQDHLRRNPVPGRVVKVHVRKGELLSLSEWALREAWRLLTEGTELAGSELVLENVPVRVRCPACGYAGEARHLTEEGWHIAVPILSCPRCGSPVEVLEGRDLAIVGLTVGEAPGT